MINKVCHTLPKLQETLCCLKPQHATTYRKQRLQHVPNRHTITRLYITERRKHERSSQGCMYQRKAEERSSPAGFCRTFLNSSHGKPVTNWWHGGRTDSSTAERMDPLGSNLVHRSCCSVARLPEVKEGKRESTSWILRFATREKVSKSGGQYIVATVIWETLFNFSISSLSCYYDKSHEFPSDFLSL